MSEIEWCKHELQIGQCADCKPPPTGVKVSGYRTRGGAVFHNDADCVLLKDGQQLARRQGKKPSAPERIRWVDAQAEGLGRCKGCCEPRKPCWVSIGGTWLPGELVWIGKEDGEWWAKVTYWRGGRQWATTKSQKEVKGRDPEGSAQGLKEVG